MIETDAARIRRPLLSALYTDAMLLADDTRAWIEHPDEQGGDRLDPLAGILLSCEQLRMTTRLMIVLAWLLAWRAVDAGEMDGKAQPRLEAMPLPDMAALASFPDQARALIDDGMALYRRAVFLDEAMAQPPAVSPALAMQRRLAAAL
ncbi:hypothetical protein GCM10022268_24630 [Sphingomonas cynarae]|uniref:DUF1465 family protein n=1 Tax=Sphingomonas cynarae TaxID=930197 RepID=A0ABP7E6Y6_9SPHN